MNEAQHVTSVEHLEIDLPEEIAVEGRNDIFLRRVSQQDMPEIFHVVHEDASHISEFQSSWALEATLENTQQDIDRSMISMAEGKGAQYRIVKREANSIIGTVSLYEIDDANKTGSLGFYVIKSEEGRGIATSAARQIVQFGFDQLGLERITMGVATANSGSQKVVAKLGARNTHEPFIDSDDPSKPYEKWEVIHE